MPSITLGKRKAVEDVEQPGNALKRYASESRPAFTSAHLHVPAKAPGQHGLEEVLTPYIVVSQFQIIAVLI